MIDIGLALDWHWIDIGLTSDWNALSSKNNHWNTQYLSNKCSNYILRATSATAQVAASFTFEEYFNYSKDAQEEVPLYLFERSIPKELLNDFNLILSK